ncbi:MAG: nucleotidyl transferase AbiEii/AbiGii toxin family protein [Myxococcota bacterium]
MKNHAASVRARLLNLARTENVEFQRMLVRFANERLLFRIASSDHGDRFVLKGATLFAVWMGKPHRATKDLDLLGRGEPDIEAMAAIFREIVAVECPEDGLTFDPAAIAGSFIREEARYIGVRLLIPADLAGARVALQVDVGLGDAVVPPPEDLELPSLLALPAARMRVYPKEAVVAEKLEAMVILGLTNSRMKDYYDLDLLRRTYAFDDHLVDAIRATFARRETPVPTTLPIGLSDAFARDATKQVQWRAFLRKSGVGEGEPLERVVTGLRAWLWPVLEVVRR